MDIWREMGRYERGRERLRDREGVVTRISITSGL